jgi:polyphosphate kinase
MPRNFHRRVEALIPILDPDLRERVVGNIEIMFTDNTKAWDLGRDGSYVRVVPPSGAPLVRAQHRFVELARERAKLTDPLLRTGRFHNLDVPPNTAEESRRAKNGKKKKSVQ